MGEGWRGPRGSQLILLFSPAHACLAVLCDGASLAVECGKHTRVCTRCCDA